jgi:hypothetical protein
MIMLIPLKNKTGEIVAYTLVDDDLPESITKWRWRLNNSGYVMRDTTAGNRKTRVHFILHREVLGVPREQKCHVDHINGDRLDNRRENLRVATPSENHQNRPVRTRRGTYRGVTWKVGKSGKGKWCARATIDYKTYHVGYYDDEEAAALAVMEWRREHMTHSTRDEVSI